MTQKPPLTSFVLSIKNLKKRSFRTKSLIVIVAVFAFTVFCGGLLSQSLSLGKDYMSGRMGADIMVVPRGCSISLEDTLLRSRSNTFFMDENLTEEIASMPGVEKVSPQLYVGSLNASCCSVPVQLIGFEPETDFTIKSWMTNIDSSKLGLGEIVTGTQVNATFGEKVWFYGQPFKVVAKLDDTGMGFDTAVFMTMETAKHMIEISNDIAVRPAGDGNYHISGLFVKLDNKVDVSSVVKNIISKYPQTDVVILKDMMGHIKNQLDNIKGLIYGIQGLLWLVSIFIIGVIFTVTTNERKRECGLILALGATRKKLESLLVIETLLTSISGGIVGVGAASFIMFEFRMLIATSLGIPYMQPTRSTTIILGAISLLISVSTGMAACLFSVIRIGRMETHIMIREYE